MKKIGEAIKENIGYIGLAIGYIGIIVGCMFFGGWFMRKQIRTVLGED